MIMSSFNGGNSLSERLGAYDDFAAVEDRPNDFFPSLVSLGFIKAAIRRSRRFWCVTAAVGFFLGFAVYLTSPHAYQASTSLLLTPGPYENVNTEAADDQAMAESRAVAGLAVRELGLRQSAGSFLSTYSVSPVTTRVLLITVSAQSSDQAVVRANAVATAFLQFRADELRTGQKLVLDSINQQINQATRSISSINAQISKLSAQPASSTQQSQLSALRTERAQATATLTNLQQSLIGEQTNVEPSITAAVRNSVVLDAAAPVRHSRLKPLLLYAAVGLFMGLAVGLSVVVIRALVSDRLRQRDDIAHALGAPVKLSVGNVRLSRWLPGRHGLAAADRADVRRIVTYLDRTVPGRSWLTPTLAVVPVDDLGVPALCLTSLAVSCAEQGKQVVVADMCSGAPAARLLKVKDPGVRAVSAYDGRLVVAIPGRDDVVPVGPLEHGSAEAQQSAFAEALADACASADLLLTLVTLDPSLGGEHLATWATDAVVIVTAGRSSWTRIQAVGEMIRLSGTRLVSAVLVGADSTDESLGVLHTAEVSRDVEVMEQDLHSGLARQQSRNYGR
jgi:capsular polysaccharide biosynthesis protein